MTLLAEKCASAASTCSGVMVVPQFLDEGRASVPYRLRVDNRWLTFLEGLTRGWWMWLTGKRTLCYGNAFWGVLMNEVWGLIIFLLWRTLYVRLSSHLNRIWSKYISTDERKFWVFPIHRKESLGSKITTWWSKCEQSERWCLKWISGCTRPI